MADRPILFSAAMVQALLREVDLEGTGKTQTRRILKPQPDQRTTQVSVCRDLWIGCGPSVTGGTSQWDRWQKLRFAVGDRLWVKETWQTGSGSLGPQIAFRATGDLHDIEASDDRPAADTFVDTLPDDLKKIIAENWDYIVSVKVASAAQVGAA